MVYFTADTHFDHANIIRFCDRPFTTVEEMNEALIANWNRKVHANDTVFIMGDMFFRTTDPEPILRRLKGKKHLIVGNHDSQWMKKEASDGQHSFTLCHYPLLSWNHQRRTWMIHGHIHEDTSMDFWPLILARENVLNAGVDVNNYEPVSFQELVENNAKFKAMHPSQTDNNE